MAANAPENVDEYVASFPPDVRDVLEHVRAAIHAGVPDGEEKVRYGMGAVMLGGRYAIHFAGWKHHVGLYPVPTFDDPLEQEVAPYRSKKDTVNGCPPRSCGFAEPRPTRPEPPADPPRGRVGRQPARARRWNDDENGAGRVAADHGRGRRHGPDVRRAGRRRGRGIRDPLGP